MIRPVRPDGRIETGGTFVPVVRRRVLDRIASAAMQRVVLIVAPAGYGKSVALRQFLESATEPYVRYDVLAEDAGLLGFLRGFADALAEVAPDARATLAGAYERNAQSQTPGTDLAMWMHTHIKQFRGTIAIDDLHVAQDDREVTRFLASLIERTKGRAQWIVASRSTIGLPIGTWLAYGESDLAIDEHDLKFTVEEAKDAARSFRLGVRDEELYELLHLTDGWATAMSFALRSSTRSVDLRNISTMTREMVYRYLAEQVFQTLNDEEREFLEAAALLSEIESDVLIAAGFDRARALVEDLRQRVAFIHEQSPGVYRLHDLFKDFVLHQLALRGEDFARSLRVKVARAMQDAGKIAIAMRLFTEASAHEELEPLLETHGLDLLERGHADMLESPLEFLERAIETKAPRVLALRGAMEIGAGKFQDGERLLLRAAAAAQNTALRAELIVRVSTLRLNRGEKPQELLQDVVRAPGDVPRPVLLEARALLAVSLVRSGDVAGAESQVALVEPELQAIDDVLLRAKLLQRLAAVRSQTGHAELARKQLLEVTEIASSTGRWSLTSRAYMGLSIIALLHDSDTTLSLWYAQQSASAAGKAGDYFDLQVSLLQMLSIETRRGNADRAAQLERQLGELKTSDNARALYIASSQAHRHAWAGRFNDAHRLFGSVVERQTYPADRAMTHSLYALCLALDSRGKESGSAVAAVLDKLGAESGPADGDGALLFEFAVLICALAEALSGRHTSSQRILRRPALSGHQAAAHMREAVETLSRAAKSPDYAMDEAEANIEAVRAVGFGGYARYLALAEEQIKASYEPESVVRLTPSELRILRCLAAGMAPKDIAAEIGRSVFTVQTHIQNLMEKLGCHGRTEAIALARRMGLLDQS